MSYYKKKAAGKKAFNVDIASQRISRLFELAAKAFDKSPGLADRYVALARRIGTRHRVRIPKEYRRRMCKKCGAYLVPGVNSRTRLDGVNVVRTCMACGDIKREPYARGNK
jgi:ribonuclease P protein subunit RPR2